MNMDTIKEIDVKSVMTKSSLPVGGYSVNPYVGCPHACRYCYASFMKRFTGHTEPWGTFLDVKNWKPITNPHKYDGERVVIGSVTDGYNPYEEEFHRTRRLLEELRGSDAEIMICTKSDLVLRDLDLLKSFPKVTVSWSVNTLDEQFCADMDNAVSIERRLKAMRQTYEAGIRTVCFVSPIFPRITDVKAIIEEVKDYADLIWLENLNLEAMAKQLYDYWFVQFDFPNENGKPYKSSGGKMVWNEKLKREIPKGWNVLKLGEHCSFNKRTSNGYFNHPILYLDTSNITNNTIDELQFLNPSSDIIPSRARRLVQEGDIVYSTVRPNLKHFGIIMNPDYNMVVSTGFAVITANWSAYRYFIYQFLIQAATIENLSTIAQSAVSAYPSINTSDIENLDLVVPPDSMIEKYAKTACRLYLQIDTNYKEIKSLTKQRDELLPLLMNGQVSVNSDLSLG